MRSLLRFTLITMTLAAAPSFVAADEVALPTPEPSGPQNWQVGSTGVTISDATKQKLDSLKRFGGKTFTERMDAVTGSPAAMPYAVAWTLIVLGLLVSLILQQLNVVSGVPSQPRIALGRAIVAAAVLAAYVPLTRAIWWGTSSLSTEIYTAQNREALATMTETMNTRALTSTIANFIPILGWLYNLRNMIVDALMTLCMWSSSFAVDSLNVLQVCIYNVLFCFGPLMISLHAFGLGTARLWLMATLEICSWSITGSIVQWTMYRRFMRQFADAAWQGLANLEWWDALKEMGFLMTILFAVPIITSRLLGMTALGELSRSSIGSNLDGWIANKLASWGTVGATGSPQFQGGGDNRRSED